MSLNSSGRSSWENWCWDRHCSWHAPATQGIHVTGYWESITVLTVACRLSKPDVAASLRCCSLIKMTIMKCSVGCVPLSILVHQCLVKYSLYGSQRPAAYLSTLHSCHGYSPTVDAEQAIAIIWQLPIQHLLKSHHPSTTCTHRTSNLHSVTRTKGNEWGHHTAQRVL